MSPADIIKAFGEYRAPLLTVHLSDYYAYGGLHADENTGADTQNHLYNGKELDD